MEILLTIASIIHQIINAGNAITALSLLLYALTFNLRERVARILAMILGCVALVFFSVVLAGTTLQEGEVATWMRLGWLGISFLPAAYVHISDALLEATGRPSRGRRHFVIRLSYLLGLVFFIAAALTDTLVGDLVQRDQIHYLQAGPWFPLFLLFFAVILGFSAVNIWRTYQRCLTRTSRRRMRYLMVGFVGPVIGVFPFLTLTQGGVLAVPALYWAVRIVANALVAALLVLMTYAVAYFGVAVPDRVVKSRLFQWILRGPVVVSTVLAVTVLVNRMAQIFGVENSRAVPFSMVAMLLVLQFVITLLRQPVERLLFYGEDRNDVIRLQLLEERLLTTGDLRQFLESILNAACDISATRSAFIAVVGEDGLELEVSVGPDDPLRGSADLPPLLMTDEHRNYPALGTLVRWDAYWLLPLRIANDDEPIGMLGLYDEDAQLDVQEEAQERLALIAERAILALSDRRLQRDVFAAVDRLVPFMEHFRRLQAAARYGNTEALTTPVDSLPTEADLANLVREALGHYWGGPRLTNSPLLGLQVVREALNQYDGNPVNTLRAILRQAIDQMRPEGERRFTAEWMLFNIMEMKFLEGRKVRDIAMRLAMSEADLYRKQRVAIEAVSQAIAEMEREAVARASGDDDG